MLISSYEGMAYGMTQLFKRIVSICIMSILALGMARFNFKNQTVTMTTC